MACLTAFEPSRYSSVEDLREISTRVSQDSTGLDIVQQSSHPLVRQFSGMWNAKRRSGGLPSRSDFEIDELMPWFGHVIIMDVIDGGRDFRYRMIGTRITEFLDRDYTGKCVSECEYGEGRAKVVDTFRRPIIVQGPVHRSGQVIWAADKTWRRYDSVHCPLARDADTPEFTIGVLYFGAAAVSRSGGLHDLSG